MDGLQALVALNIILVTLIFATDAVFTGPTDTSVLQGNSATLTCSDPDFTSGVRQWSEGATTFANQEGVFSGDTFTRYENFDIPTASSDSTNLDLVISNVQVSDEGTYSCEITPTPAQDATLSVEIEGEKPSIIVTEGSSGEYDFICTARGYRPGVSLEWYKDGVEITTGITGNTPTDNGDGTFDSSSTLTMALTPQDNGATVECRTTGQVVAAVQTGSITLAAPVVSVTYEGGRLTCSASGAVPDATKYEIIQNVTKVVANGLSAEVVPTDYCITASCNVTNAVGVGTAEFPEQICAATTTEPPTTGINMSSKIVATLRKVVRHGLHTTQRTNISATCQVPLIACSKPWPGAYHASHVYTRGHTLLYKQLRPLSCASKHYQKQQTTPTGDPSDLGTSEASAGTATASDSLSSSSLPQLDVPDYHKELMFKGLETDFPCLSRLPSAGPEPEYQKISSGYQVFHSDKPFHLKYKGVLPELHIAYETWGQLNQDRTNVVIINTGMSASSHVKSHQDNPTPGWWEKFLGPGCAVDTDKFFVICSNVLGGCYGTIGPSSLNPVSGKPYGTHFPLVTVEDMVKALFLLLDHLEIQRVYATVGSSLGGMLSLMAPALFPDRVGRAICISSCAQTHPSTIAMRYLQRRAIMTDPNWARGHYYGQSFPRMGMKLARELGTITYRSGAEWLNRFGRSTISNEQPSLCPYFEIESYIEHQGEQFSVKYDPNSLLYLSKAMDFFDMGEGFSSVLEGIARVKCPVMVMGAKTDILIPVTQQRQLASLLQESGNDCVTYYELDSIYGHDTFLLDLNNVGAAIKGQLETELKEHGMVRKDKPRWLKDQQG